MSDRSHAQQAAGQRERERLPQAAVWRRSAAAAAAAPAVDTRLGLCLLRYFRLFRITLVSTPSLRLQIRALQPPPSSSTKERASARPPDARSCCSSILGGLSDTRPFFFLPNTRPSINRPAHHPSPRRRATRPSIRLRKDRGLLTAALAPANPRLTSPSTASAAAASGELSTNPPPRPRKPAEQHTKQHAFRPTDSGRCRRSPAQNPSHRCQPLRASLTH